MLVLLLYLAANSALALAATWRRALTPLGAAAAVAVGTGIAWAGGFRSWALLGIFFFSSTLVSAWRKSEKREAESLTGKGGRRDALQVLANGAPALACALVWKLTGHPALLVALAAALAEANADTWGSEAGLLSRHSPRSILTLRPVPRGHSGGVTLLGTLAAAGGSVIVAAGFGIGLLVPGGAMEKALAPAVVAAIVGFAGSLLDSVLGAGVQARYRNAEGEYTERRRDPEGLPNDRVRGIPGFTNDAVNFASGAASALAALLIGLTAW